MAIRSVNAATGDHAASATGNHKSRNDVTNTMRQILIAAAMAMTWASDASALTGEPSNSTGRPYYIYPAVTFAERSELLLASAAARRFRVDCPKKASDAPDGFRQSLERVSKFIDELGADAATIKQLDEANAGPAGPGFSRGDDPFYCDYVFWQIHWLGRLR